jgi:hypothetical protein
MQEEDFWGFMLKKGSQIMRLKDQNDRSSALAILDTVVRKQTTVTLRIQDEMSQGLGLEQTGAGQQLNHDILEERKRYGRAAAGERRSLGSGEPGGSATDWPTPS